MRLRVPHPLVLLTGGILLAAVASHVLTPGEYDRRLDDATGRNVVVPGTYSEVERNPVNAFDAIVAIPRGMMSAGEVIFLVFLIGGAFTVVDATGALRRGAASLAHGLAGRDIVIIPIVSICFAMGGVVQNMQEEVIPLIPVVLLLSRGAGFQPLVAVAMSLGAAMVGSAFSPINPFQVIIAQQLAEITPGSGWLFRSVILILAIAVWIAFTMRYAARTRTVAGSETSESADVPAEPGERLLPSDKITLGLVGATFAIISVGLLNWDWGFNELSAAFVVMGMIVGAISRMGVSGTAEAFVRGFREMAFAGLLLGFARAIYVVLSDGRVVDTIVHAIFTPLESLPLVASAAGMTVAQAALHVAVPSVTGQAVLTMPIAVPLADLLGMSRQVSVLAFQYGGGLCDVITPTNGALMAVLAAARVRYEEWFRFAMPIYALLLVFGIAAIALAINIGYG